MEVVKRNELHTFVVLPKRWVVERSFAWLEKCRRLWNAKGSSIDANGGACLHGANPKKIVNRLLHYGSSSMLDLVGGPNDVVGRRAIGVVSGINAGFGVDRVDVKQVGSVVPVNAITQRFPAG